MNAIVEGQPPAGMSIGVEDWFMVSNLASAIDASSWSRRESRVEENTDRLLGHLAEQGVTATFFMLGWVAERFPALLDRIHRAGHEIGAHDMNHEPVSEIRPGFHEACISCVPVGRRGLPWEGGGWFRLLGDFRWTSLSDLVGRCAAGPAGR